jgi:hypothetical protein
MTEINRPFKAFHTFCVAVVLPPFSVPCPGATHSRTALLCYARLVPMRPVTYRGQTICFAFQHLERLLMEDERKSRCTGGGNTHPQALLLPGSHHFTFIGKVTVQLSFLPDMLHLDLMNNATDRFMRNSICGCYGSKRLLLLHHAIYHGRPL